jgi:hypothetical protein
MAASWNNGRSLGGRAVCSSLRRHAYVADVQDKKGIVYGSARDGSGRGVIEGTLPESIAIDRDGSVYAGETTTGHTLRKFVKP